MLQVLVWQVIRGNGFCFGGDYEIPVAHGLLDANSIEEIKEDETYSPLSFSREYGSIWSGGSDNAFFNPEIIDKSRVLKHYELKYSLDVNQQKEGFYIFAVDVGRIDCVSVVTVFKCYKKKNGVYMKDLVYLETIATEHFEEQAIRIKDLYQDFNPRAIVIDAQGMGIGLVDFLIIPTHTKDMYGHEIVLPPFGVTNNDDYDKYLTSDSIKVLYLMKATPELNSFMHVNVLNQFISGNVRLLVNEVGAKKVIAKDSSLKNLPTLERFNWMRPYIDTDILKEEMMNLQEAKTKNGRHVTLEQANRKIKKDSFSSLEYGLWWIKEQIEDPVRKKKRKINNYADAMFVTFANKEKTTRRKLRGGAYNS